MAHDSIAHDGVRVTLGGQQNLETTASLLMFFSPPPWRMDETLFIITLYITRTSIPYASLPYLKIPDSFFFGFLRSFSHNDTTISFQHTVTKKQLGSDGCWTVTGAFKNLTLLDYVPLIIWRLLPCDDRMNDCAG